MEMGKEEIAGKDYLVLMEPEPMSRLKTQYRSLRRQLCFIQSICVLFCVTCCLFTIIYHSYPSTCKENGTKEAAKYGMQHQGSKEMNQTQTISVTRLTANPDAFARKENHVPWKHARDPDHPGYFTLDEDGESLTVHHGGTYKVSLQITYRGVEKRNDTLILQHDIHRYTDSYVGYLPLLTYLETVNFTSPYWRKSLFSEGIFPLESGDKLKVWTNSLSLIDVGEKLEQKTSFVVYPHFST
ncbi:hypothetical protein ABG768_026326 [Culter alburnus]|uniref:THD domain-containing protein n=1 Tax=Culter alburnus TaxID=194366 RepID=A0AAW2AAC7_CULAL